MPYLDSYLLLERLAARRADEARWDAALHDKRLR